MVPPSPFLAIPVIRRGGTSHGPFDVLGGGEIHEIRGLERWGRLQVGRVGKVAVEGEEDSFFGMLHSSVKLRKSELQAQIHGTWGMAYLNTYLSQVRLGSPWKDGVVARACAHFA